MRPVFLFGILALTIAACGRTAMAEKADAPSPSTALPVDTDGRAAQASPAAAEPAADMPAGDSEPVAHVQFGSPAGATGTFGSIAASAEGKFLVGYGAFDFPSRPAAEQAAVEGCREEAVSAKRPDLADGCRAAVYFSHACGALAQGKDGAWGTGWAEDGWREACGYAASTCRDFKGVECRGFVYVCSPGGLQGTCDGTIQTEDGETRLSPGD